MRPVVSRAASAALAAALLTAGPARPAGPDPGAAPAVSAGRESARAPGRAPPGTPSGSAGAVDAPPPAAPVLASSPGPSPGAPRADARGATTPAGATPGAIAPAPATAEGNAPTPAATGPGGAEARPEAARTGDDLWVPGNKRTLSRERWQAPQRVPVRFDGKVLFQVRGGIGDITPADRARNIEARLRAIASADAPVGSPHVEDGEFSDVFMGDRFVASIADVDADASGPARAGHAREVASAVHQALVQYRNDRSPKALLRAGIEAAVATAALVGFLLLVRIAFRKLGGRVGSAVEKLLSRARIQRLQLITPEVQARLVRWSGKAVRLLLVAVAVFAWLEVVLTRFPWTRDHADRSLRFVLGAVGSVLAEVVAFLPKLVYIALFALVGYGASQLNRAFFSAVERGAIRLPGFFPEWARPTARVVGLLIFALVAVAVFPYLPGSGSSAFQAIGIFLGAVISMGSGSSVSNAIAGFVITYMRPFAVGDFVKIGDTTGTVTEQSALVVRVLTIRNENVTLPASMVLSSQIVNYSAQARTSGVAIRTSVTIGYDVPWRRVQELLLEAASRTTQVLELPKPWVIQTALSDFYVCYELDVYVDRPEIAHLVLSELNQNVQDAFFHAGVEILSPHYAQLRDGNKAAIPDEWLPAGERARSFKVSAVVRDASPSDPVPAGHLGGDAGPRAASSAAEGPPAAKVPAADVPAAEVPAAEVPAAGAQAAGAPAGAAPPGGGGPPDRKPPLA
jgi:small-conductance mechanosensitive channel